MRLLLLIIAFYTISPAAYLYQNRNLCVDDYYYTQSDRTLHFKRSDKDSYQTTTNKEQIFIDGYDYNASNDICAPKQVLRDLQISNENYHFLIALIAVLTGFTFVFFAVYIVVEVAKK